LRRAAGSLKRELQSKYGIRPKVKHAMGELEILVNGRRVFSHKETGTTPGTAEPLALITSDHQ